MSDSGSSASASSNSSASASSNSSASASSSSSGSGSSGSGTSSKGGLTIRLSSQQTKYIALIACGVAVGLVLIIALVCFFRCKRKKKERTKKASDLEAGDDQTVTYASLQSRNGSQAPSMQPPSSQSGGLWEDPAIVVTRIPRASVVAEALISRGGYGEVYRGSYNGEVVAIKMLLPAHRKDIKQINGFLAEAKIMAAVEHERIVRFVGVAWDSLNDLCVVSEFMDGGDLRSLLTRFESEEHRPHGFDEDKIRVGLHVAHALVYLHSLQPIVIHRDLKSKNILLSSQLDAKLTDFGVSRETSEQTMTAGVGTSLWMAPEIMMGERYDEKADIFSFGVVLTELDSHQLPYASAKSTNSGRTRPDTAILQLVAMGKLQAQFSTQVSESMRALGEACLSLDPKDRPTAAEVMYRLQTATKSHTV